MTAIDGWIVGRGGAGAGGGRGQRSAGSGKFLDLVVGKDLPPIRRIAIIEDGTFSIVPLWWNLSSRTSTVEPFS